VAQPEISGHSVLGLASEFDMRENRRFLLLGADYENKKYVRVGHPKNHKVLSHVLLDLLNVI
jgi:hypothetical protein